MSTNWIDDAISCLSRAADMLRNRGEYKVAQDFESVAREAERELRRLNSELPRMRDLKRAADREYDAYVTRPR